MTSASAELWKRKSVSDIAAPEDEALPILQIEMYKVTTFPSSSTGYEPGLQIIDFETN